MKLYKYLYFFLIPCIFFGQNNSEKIKKIDNLLKISRQLSYSNSEHSIKKAQKAIKLAEKEKYAQGIAEAYNIIAYTLFYLRIHKESLYYAKKGEKYIPEDNYVQKADLRSVLGDICMELGLYDEAEKEFRQKLHLSDKIVKKNTKIIYICDSYSQMGFLYAKKDNIDSSNCYYKKSLQNYSLSKVNIIDFSNYSEVYVGLGLNFIKMKKLDSAELYINKSFEILENHHISIKDYSLYALGILAKEKKQYEKALYFFFESIKDEKKINPKVDINNLYKNVAEIYSAMHHFEKEKEFLKKSIKQKDSIEIERNKSIEFVLKNLINTEQQENEKQQRNIYLFSSIISIIILFSFCIGYVLMANDTKEKERKLLEKEQVISEKEEETIHLQKKINESFEEVIYLAKENNPEFFTRFKEIYPEFVDKLLVLFPNLRTSELTFCAFLFLNFSTKDIAEFTFTSPRTVQTRKYMIRKKLNIPSKTDIYVWIHNIYKSE